MNKCLWIVSAVGVGALAGCASSKPEPGAVAQAWSSNTRQLAISPLFPPRERFYPGDLYIAASLSAADSKKDKSHNYLLRSHRFDHVDLSDALKAEQTIATLPALASYKDEAGKDVSTWPLSAYPASGGRVNGLVAFPGFTFASASSSQLGANVSNGGWGALFGGAHQSHYTVSYSVPAAEYISVPMRAAMAAFRQYRTGLDSSSLNDLALLAHSVRPQDGGAVLVYPNEVYYARALDITVTADDATSANLSAVTLAMVEMSDRQTKLQTELDKLRGTPAAAGAAAPAASATKQGEIDRLQSQIDTLQTRLDQAARSVVPSVPGVTGSVTRSSSQGVTLRQTFNYPVAIGYRGVEFDIDQLVKGGVQVHAGSRPGLPLHREIPVIGTAPALGNDLLPDQPEAAKPQSDKAGNQP